ncbi:MAG: glycosyl hydrolase [Planctomycetia bacterium]|nr:glycosyl hydrolase [Planctomycetia bacterium]
MKKWFCIWTLFLSSLAYGQEISFNALQSPPMEAKPWCYYWILKGNITPDQITRDLEAMADKGFGGILLFDSRYYYDEFDSKEHVPVPLHIKHIFMSESWQALILHLLREADRLGMKVSLNISDSGGMLRGPWDMREWGPKELVWTEENVNGPKEVTITLPKAPDDFAFYSDTNLVAVRLKTGAVKDRENIKLGSTWYGVQELSPNALEVTDVVDLKPFVREGRLLWNVPDGAWKILRFGYKVVGDFGSVDILNEKAVSRYFHRFADPILEKAGPLAGKTLTHFYNVSWEGSNPNWTPGFEETFQKRNGYSLVKFLPVLCGFSVENAEVSQRFLTDYYRTVSWCFQEHCYANIGRMCHARGIVWHSEDGGPWRRSAPIFREADMLTFWGQNDIAQGEFWVGNDWSKTRSNMRFAAMASHLYGHNEVACEAFTHMSRHWTMFPARLKPAADTNFIDGMNMIIWHTFTASPEEHGKPGLEYFAGTHVNRNVTWFPYLDGFLSYLGRCQYLLRTGRPVVDACVYVSDKNYIGWGRGEKWNEKSPLSLADGCTYDLLDTPSLLKLEYVHGTLQLATGLTYRVLVVDPLEDELPLEALRKLESLQKQGAPIVFGEKKPQRDRGLKNYPHGDAEMAEIVGRIWQVADPENNAARSLRPAMEGPFAYNHRKTDKAEIFFIQGSGEGTCVFHTAADSAVLFDAAKGVFGNVALAKTDDGRRSLTLHLPEYGSCFVLLGMTAPAPFPPAPEKAEAKPLDGAWTATFGTKQVRFASLSDWTENADSEVKYFSGTATYVKEFDLPAGTHYTTLQLGVVHHLADVRLNGTNLGTVWTAPWEVSIPNGLLKAGKNRLEIDVVNCWANRLIGDTFLPAEQRTTKSNLYLYEKPGDIPPGGKKPYRVFQGFHQKDTLLPSGLLGPVTLE